MNPPTLTPLGYLGTGHESHIFGINGNGDSTGDSASDENIQNGNAPPHAFSRSSAGVFTQLDVNPPFTIAQSRGASINSSGTVVGRYSATTGDDFPNADGFLWDGSMHQLENLLSGNSGWSSLLPASINDSGQIVGQGTYNSAQRAFRMDPISGPGPNVNGPSKFPPLADFASSQTLVSALIAPAAAPATAPGNADQKPSTEMMPMVTGTPSPVESSAGPARAERGATPGSVELAALDMELLSWSRFSEDALR